MYLFFILQSCLSFIAYSTDLRYFLAFAVKMIPIITIKASFQFPYNIPLIKLVVCCCLSPFLSVAVDSETVFHDLDSDGSLSQLGDCLLATAEGGLLTGRLGNPIDRLYSMQNSYFTS